MRTLLSLFFLLFSVDCFAQSINPSYIASISGALPPFVLGDWALWDGTNDGALVEDYTGTDQWNTGQYATIDDNRSLHVYSSVRGEDTTQTDLKVAIVSVNGSTKKASLGTQTILDTVENKIGLPSLTKLSDTRFLATNVIAVDGTIDVYLLDETGALIDSDTYSTDTDARTPQQVVAHSSTLAVLAFTGKADFDGYLLAIDVTGDNISFGTRVEFADSIAWLSTNPGLIAFTATRGMVFTDRLGFRYTISGTDITIGSNIRFSNGTSGVDGGKKSDAIIIDDDTALVVFNRSNLRYASVVSDDGTTQTKLDEINLSATKSDIWKSPSLVELIEYQSGVQDGYYLSVFQSKETGEAGKVMAVLFSWDGVNLTKQTEVNIIDIDGAAEHPTIHKFENGLVIYHHQDAVLWDWKVLSP